MGAVIGGDKATGRASMPVCGFFGCLGVAPGDNVSWLASIYISKRDTSTGRSYHVKYRLHGRYGRIEHAGAFPSKREAELRARTVRDWIAQAKDPRLELARLFEPGATLLDAGERWLRSRRAITRDTAAEYERRIRRLHRDLDGIEVGRITTQDVDEWMTEAGRTLRPSTVREYLSTLRAVIDHAGVEPNPARDRRIEPPRRERKVIRPPDADTTLAVLARVNPKHRPAVVLIEQTGMRVSEALAVRPADVDRAGRRLLAEHTKTRRPRWVPLPAWLADDMPEIQPAARQAIFNTLRAACDDAGVPRFGPHMLRHRRASIWHMQGVPIVQAAEWLGHSPKVHLDTYAHVMPVGEIEPHRLA